MTPETPPPHGPEREPARPRNEPPFGPEATASLERSLAQLRDPDDALRILHGVENNGASFAAYLLLPGTDLAAEDITDTFHDTYVDAWQHFAQFRHDILEGLGWLQAVTKVMDEQGIPNDNLLWNFAVVDKRIHETYDVVHLDGWWHVFNK